MAIIEIVIIAVLSIILLGLVIYILYESVFAYISIRGPIFVSSAENRIKSAIELLGEINTDTKIVDLGSGDGIVLKAIAEKCPSKHIYGFEVNPFLVRRSQKMIQEAGLADRVHIIQKNFWDVDLAEFDVIFIYFNRTTIKKFDSKLKLVFRDGQKIISNYFKLSSFEPIKTINNVHLYELHH